LAAYQPSPGTGEEEENDLVVGEPEKYK